MERAYCYVDRDNSFLITLKKDKINLTVAEMNSISKVEIKFDGKYYDSATYPACFEKDADTASYRVKPNAFGLPVMNKGDVVEFIVYDAGDYINGIVWGQFLLIMKGDAV